MDEHFWLGLYDALSGLQKMFSSGFSSVSGGEKKCVSSASLLCVWDRELPEIIWAWDYQTYTCICTALAGHPSKLGATNKFVGKLARWGTCCNSLIVTLNEKVSIYVQDDKWGTLS